MAWSSCGHAASQNVADDSSDRVLITLRPTVKQTSQVIRLSDVAEISGGRESLRRRIAELDLEDSATNSKFEITPRQIEFRLRLAGIDPQRVQIRGSTTRGASSTEATRKAIGTSRSLDSRKTQFVSQSRQMADTVGAESGIERAVLEAAKACLLRQMPWSDDKLVVKFAQNIPRELNALSSIETAFSAEWRSTGTPLGRIVLRIVCQSEGQKPLEFPVAFDVRHIEEVIVTTRPLARGQVLTDSDLTYSRQDVTQQTGYVTSPDQILGQRVKRILPSAHLLKSTDLEAAPKELTPQVVKRRDRVNATARSGALVIRMSGEAQQDGRVGDIIKIRNSHSNALISARVLSAAEVEVVE